jgi:hypothetical protein
MEPQKIEDVMKQRGAFEKQAIYHKSQAQRLLKTIDILIALQLVTEEQVAHVEDVIDSTSFFKDK